MVAPAESRIGTLADPPCPLTPELRSDIAYRRACGHSWDALGAALHYLPDALRRAAEDDPDFADAQEKAWAQITWEGEADGMRRLRALANGSDDERALEAAEVLVKYARERRRDDTRLTIERLRDDTRRAAIEARAAATGRAEEAAAPQMVYHVPTAEERAAQSERETLKDATKPGAYVYVWGGKHSLGREVPPDESDTRVRLIPDWSCGLRHTVYWVVPEAVRERVSGTGIIFPEDNTDVLLAARPGA